MFDGMPVPVPAEQFHQFIAPTRTNTPTTTLPFLHHHLSSSTFQSLHVSPTPNINNNTFIPFDPYSNPSPPPPPHHHHQIPVLQQHQHNLFHHPLHHKDDAEQEQDQKEPNSTVVSSSINFDTTDIERDHQRQLFPTDHDDELMMDSNSWTNDEVLALLRIRSSMDQTWFPQLTWDHVSRKLAELGFKKSAEKCKEKFEDESRYFNTNINNCSKNNNNYRFLSELEELYHQGSVDHDNDDINNNENPDDDDNHVVITENTQQHQLEDMMGHHTLEQQDSIKQSEEQSEEIILMEKSKAREERKRKRKRRGRFEMFKGFCESIVKKMMAQQEEIHNKLLEDMMKRDAEKFAREEAWKKQEIEKMNKELEIMAQEQAIAGDRQATIIQFLKKCAESSSQNFDKHKIAKDPNRIRSTSNCSSPPPLLHYQNPNSSTRENNLLEPITHSSNVILDHQIQINCSSPNQTDSGLPCTIPGENPSSSRTLQVLSSPSSSYTPPNNNSKKDNNPQEYSNSVSTFTKTSSSTTKDDVGRRWPRDEVLALINLRCTILKNSNNNNEDHQIKEGNNKVVPLWERISQGMAELGYKRSAKRCKEKWENINKYFRKTKDVNKKRSIDSRTCPYFHQLRNLYSEGKLCAEKRENQLNNVLVPITNSGQLVESSSQVGPGEFSNVHHDDHHGGEETLVQVPPLNFD